MNQSVLRDVLTVCFRGLGGMSGLYLAMLGIMLVIGGPDGNAPVESRVIGGLYAAYGVTCTFCCFAKAKFLLNNRVWLPWLYVFLLFPLVYILMQDHAAFSKLPSSFLAYASVIIIFLLVRWPNRKSSTDCNE